MINSTGGYKVAETAFQVNQPLSFDFRDQLNFARWESGGGNSMKRAKEGKIWLEILDLHDWRKIITQTMIEKSSSRDVLVGKIIQFKHSSKKNMYRIFTSLEAFGTPPWTKQAKIFCFHGVYIPVYGNKYTVRGIVFTKEFCFIVMFVSLFLSVFIRTNNIKYTQKKAWVTSIWLKSSLRQQNVPSNSFL